MAVNLLLASFSVLAAAEIPKQASPSASRSMVSVSVTDARGKPGSEGSGVVVEKDRVVTSCSLVQKAKNIEVARSGMALSSAWIRASSSDGCVCISNILKAFTF